MADKEIIIDVRSREQFEQESIPGARSIPLEELDESLDQFGKDSKIKVVCNRGGQRSQKAIELLQSKGYSQTEVIEGGIIKWKEEHQG